MIRIKRIYDQLGDDDGYRILIDRLWPRGISKENAHVDLWLKEIAPSTELRKWFQHDPAKWEEFGGRYRKELFKEKENLHRIKDLEKEHGNVTLLYAGKDEEHTHALVLLKMLNKKT
ncbi:hypothetical protein PSM36_2368 [Proteiniphilum saccharofermentans]|uniref:DUF488 domain-containing protein n=1 Tax=Proteiniphilum saccharofermentans TaxID=1642647 RepID=A0A1R3SYA6_9BACT|nr:DUF488 domain-containing protein [Proteiniphilum saccharofermentans]SCD21173.1 hypothetical protein PSM36_2368 [Proteiniphilum saccharofermentans]